MTKSLEILISREGNPSTDIINDHTLVDCAMPGNHATASLAYLQHLLSLVGDCI